MPAEGAPAEAPALDPAALQSLTDPAQLAAYQAMLQAGAFGFQPVSEAESPHAGCLAGPTSALPPRTARPHTPPLPLSAALRLPPRLWAARDGRLRPAGRRGGDQDGGAGGGRGEQQGCHRAGCRRSRGAARPE